MIDPRLFLNIGGPMAPQQMLQPGFRPPGPGPGAPMGQMPGAPQMSIPGFGGGFGKPGVRPSTSGREMPGKENDGLAGAIAGVQGVMPNPDGTFSPPPMPTDIGRGQGGPGFGSFMSFLRGLF